jgi:hypothetical protein
LLDHVTGYFDARIELVKLDVKEELSKLLGKVAVYLVLLIVVAFFLFFISLALAYTLSEYTGMFGGFAIVAGVYLLAGMILFQKRVSLSDKIERELKVLMKLKKK